MTQNLTITEKIFGIGGLKQLIIDFAYIIFGKGE